MERRDSLYGRVVESKIYMKTTYLSTHRPSLITNVFLQDGRSGVGLTEVSSGQDYLLHWRKGKKVALLHKLRRMNQLPIWTLEAPGYGWEPFVCLALFIYMINHPDISPPNMAIQ